MKVNYSSYISNTLEVSTEDLDTLVHWDCYQLSRSTARFGMLKFISKFIGKDIASGTVMKRRKQRPHSNCPICHSPDEDNFHILTCPSASTFRSTLIVQFHTWLNAQHTDPCIISFLCNSLQTWFFNPTSTNTYYSSDPIISSAYNAQSKLGWYAFLCGYISSALVTAQAVYYLESGSRRSATRWGSHLIAQAWNITFQLWDNRNNILHESDRIHHLHGFSSLRNAITTEYSIGILQLPPLYRRYFSLPLQQLLHKPATYLKRWFLVIRSGRESFYHQYNDDWQSDPSLRRWIGLAPTPHI